VLTKAAKTKATRSDTSLTTRQPRRGELDGVAAQYKGILDLENFKQLCGELEDGELRGCELERLHSQGQIEESPATIRKYVYGRRDTKKEGEWLVEPGSWRELGETQRVRASQGMLLGIEAEIFMANVVVRLCRRRNGMTMEELKAWVRAQVLFLHSTSVQVATSCPHRRERLGLVGSPEIGVGCATSCRFNLSWGAFNRHHDLSTLGVGGGVRSGW
jgi:hypothetical protein